MNRKISKCPYCKSKVSYFEALTELNSGEHTCPVCYKNSNISYNKMIYIPAAVSLILAIIFAAMFFLFKIVTNLILALILILIPFAAFYLITPLFFGLEAIKNEAQMPVMIIQPKRPARAKKQSRTLKSAEVAKVEIVRKEQKSTEKKKSVRGKFSQFIKTYVIVPDDEDEIDGKNDDKKSEPKVTEKSQTEFVPEEKIEQSPLSQDIVEIDDEPFIDLASEIKVPEENKVIVSEKPEEKTNDSPKKSEDKPKLNFNKLFSKLNFSDNKKTDVTTNQGILEVAENKSDKAVNSGEPVYHRLTKTNKVNFIYYPDKKAIISVDLNIPDEKPEESIIDVTESADDVQNAEIGEIDENISEDVKTEAIEFVVEKALEVEKEEENRNIANFFFAQPNENLVEESISEVQSESVVEVSENVPEQIEIINDDWVDYSPETGDFISLNLDKFKNNISKDSIISLSDVSFDIPESENIKTEDSFIDYDYEEKLPVIVISDVKKNPLVFDTEVSEESPTEYEWKLFSAEKIDFKPEIIDFNNSKVNSVVDGEINYNNDFKIFSEDVTIENQVTEDLSENDEKVKEKSKFGLFSKYVSKIKSESVFNFDKSEKNVDKVLKSGSELDEAKEVHDEILKFKEKLNEEVKVDEVLKYKSNVNDENISDINEDLSNSVESDEIFEDVTSPDIDKVPVEEKIIENAEIINIDDALDESIEKETTFDIDFDSVADEISTTSLESIELPENEPEFLKPEEFMYSEFSEQKNAVEDEPVDVDENDDYYKFDEEDDEIPENDDDYYVFDEEDDEIPENDDEYIFDEENDEIPRIDDEDFEEEFQENVEGAIEYIPEENIDDSYVVDYSEDNFEDISSGEQLDENFNLDEFREKSFEEDNVKGDEEPIVPVKIDSNSNKIEELKQQSRYEKKFPNAAKAAAEQAAALELKKQREKQAKKKKPGGETVKKDSQKSKDVQKKKDSQKTKRYHKSQEQKSGFFSDLRNKIIEATEEERQAAFEEEERERKLAEKEARRKAKEKEKDKSEKAKSKETDSAEERKKKSQKTKRIEKSKMKNSSDISDDSNTIVFESGNKEYDDQEKIVLESVKDKVKELENRKVTEAEKVKIISEKVDEEKRLEKIEKLKSEQEKQRVQKEKKRKEKQLQNERLEKAEEIRREQVKQVRKNQNERKKSEEKRNTNNVSLKEVDNVRSKVSQKKKKRKQEIDEVF